MPSQRFTMTPDATTETAVKTFVLDGLRRSNGEPWEETYTLLDDMPPGAQIDLVNGVVVDVEGNIGWHGPAIVRFVRASLVETDEERWDALIRDKDRPLNKDQLGALMFWITGETTGRPTGRRSSSSDGSPNGNGGSEADSSTPDESPAGSTPAD